MRATEVVGKLPTTPKLKVPPQAQDGLVSFSGQKNPRRPLGPGALKTVINPAVIKLIQAAGQS
ncbi:MAG: hypothetical protein COT73_00220 [Bdellovibrio sp. CG10_big_fil_rev_8_21_14_0_10_47_8]|nr:MAG: hypothetical protein COT73_00220 [Bdellovibrio sp. CG10_big_fil_rev_8_21_14_0_10_47_8]